MFDVELTQELFELSIVEMSVVIHDDRQGETIVAYYGLLDKRFYLEFGDISQGLCLDPFDEIVYHDEKKLSLQGCFWEGSQYINAPSLEGKW